MKDDVKLKACPWCGEVPELWELEPGIFTIWNTKRYNNELKILCYGCTNEEGYGDKEETIKAWNSRPDQKGIKPIIDNQYHGEWITVIDVYSGCCKRAIRKGDKCCPCGKKINWSEEEG